MLKGISAFDLDGTLLVRNSSFSFCSYLFQKKILSLKDFVTCIYCYHLHKYCGFSLKWLHLSIFNRLFRGKKIAYFIPYIESFLDEKLDQLFYVPAIQRLRQRKEENSRLIILSNSPIFLVKAIGRRLGVKEILATDYLVDASGNLSDIATIVDGSVKATYLSNVSAEEKEAYSDSMLDLPFLEAANKKIVVRPQRKLKLLATERGWEQL